MCLLPIIKESHILKVSPEAELETYLKDGRLDALANLVPYVDVSGHFGQDIGPEGWLLRSSPAERWRVPGCVLQLHATQQNMSAREPLLPRLSASRQVFRLFTPARAGRFVMHTLLPLAPLKTRCA